MINNILTVDGNLSADGKYLVISPEIKFMLDPKFYKEKGFGELGLMPKDIKFYKKNPGVEEIVTQTWGIERFGNVTMMSKEGDLGSIDLSFVCRMIRGQNRYILRHGDYKKDELFALYLADREKTPVLVGIGDVNFEEEYVAKLMGLGIKNDIQRTGHGTALLATIERECAKTNIFLLLHNPLKQAIPFYVSRGYRYLAHPNGPDFAKILNPKFDERLLMPSA